MLKSEPKHLNNNNNNNNNNKEVSLKSNLIQQDNEEVDLCKESFSPATDPSSESSISIKRGFEKIKPSKVGRVQSLVSKLEDKINLMEDFFINYQLRNNKNEANIQVINKKLEEHNMKFKINPVTKKTHLSKFSNLDKVNELKLPEQIQLYEDEEYKIKSNFELIPSVPINLLNHFISVYFKTFHIYFPVIKNDTSLTTITNENSYLLRSIACIASRFSQNSFLLSRKEVIIEHFFNIAKSEATSNYHQPNLQLVQALLLLALHSFGEGNISQQLTDQAIRLASIIKVRSPDVNKIINWNRTWVFCLEVDRLNSLIYRMPFHFKKDEAVNIKQLQDNFSLDNFPNYTYHLTLLTRRIVQQLIFKFNKMKNINQELLEHDINLLTKVEIILANNIQNLPNIPIKFMLKGFHSLIKQNNASLNLLYLCPSLIDEKSNIEQLNYEIFQKCDIQANIIYNIFITDYQQTPQLLSHRPPTSFFDLFIAAKFYKLITKLPLEKLPKQDITLSLIAHQKWVNLIIILKFLKKFWRFSEVILAKLANY